MADELLFEVADKIATITLNRPERRNAFTQEMFDAWIAALEECQARDDINVVILTGAGTAFCSGGDVKAMGERELTPLEEKDYLWKHLNRLPLTMEHMDKPVIAAVNGAAAGAGMDAALMCDIRFAGESARFSEAYIKIGLLSGEGATWFLPRLVGLGKAFEMLWTGDWVDAEEAKNIGLVNDVFPDDELQDKVREFAARIANGPSISVRMLKRMVYQG
jgi:enoyl-CoA hydratase/carnithine racemase